ncbi:helix-turn-helix domain-containing protein [bacterium]|nr:helix-turn-helix domain-containing protein [bacterium]
MIVSNAKLRRDASRGSSRSSNLADTDDSGFSETVVSQMLPFVARTEKTLAKEMPVQLECRNRAVRVSPRSQQRTDVEFRLAEKGTVELLIGGRTQVLPPQRLAVFWAGIPHQVLSHEATEIWSLRAPLHWVLSRPLSAAFQEGLLEGRLFFEPDVDQFRCDQFRMMLWAGDEPDSAQARAVALEVEARLLRLANSLPAKLTPLSNTDSPEQKVHSKSVAIAGRIAERHAESYSMTDFAQMLGLHPNYVMNLFRRELGTTILEYFTQHRLAHAMRLLATTKMSPREVASHSGFGSLRRFEATFRQSFKETPSVFRRRFRNR